MVTWGDHVLFRTSPRLSAMCLQRDADAGTGLIASIAVTVLQSEGMDRRDSRESIGSDYLILWLASTSIIEQNHCSCIHFVRFVRHMVRSSESTVCLRLINILKSLPKEKIMLDIFGSSGHL
jgi:hypothetical protein